MQELDHNFGDHFGSECSLQPFNSVIIPWTNTTGEPSFSPPSIAIEPVTLDKYLEDRQACFSFCVLFVFGWFGWKGGTRSREFFFGLGWVFLRQIKDVSYGGNMEEYISCVYFEMVEETETWNRGSFCFRKRWLKKWKTWNRESFCFEKNKCCAYKTQQKLREHGGDTCLGIASAIEKYLQVT
jgi:hypothetical protein